MSKKSRNNSNHMYSKTTISGWSYKHVEITFYIQRIHVSSSLYNDDMHCICMYTVYSKRKVALAEAFTNGTVHATVYI